MSFWIFKCDPKRYDLSGRMADPSTSISWLVTRHKKKIAPGDIVFLMETGPKRSILAVMRVESRPEELPELESEQIYWKQGRDTQTRCRVRGTILKRKTVPIEELAEIEALEDLSVFHPPHQGTNFRVSADEGQILLDLIEAR